MGYMERHACKARRGRDGVVQVEGGGFVSAAFRYRMSRAEDPLLHTHVVVGNLPRPGWSLDRAGRPASVPARQGRRLPVPSCPARGADRAARGAVDVGRVGHRGGRGGRPGVIDHFSRRRRQIMESLKQRGLSSAKAAQVATLDTRPNKAPDPRRWGGCERSGAPAPPSSASTRTSWPACSTWSSARCVTSQSMWSG